MKTIISFLALAVMAYQSLAQTIFSPNPLGQSINSNVGIGTNNPHDKLEVLGNVRIRGRSSSMPHSRLLFYRYQDNDTSKIFASIGQADLNASNSTFDIQHFNGNDIRFLNNGVEHLRISASGIVGIGTSNPTAQYGEKLHIYSNENTGLKVERSNGVIGALMSYSDQVFVGAESNHSVVLMTNATARVIVKGNGNVGIGMYDANLIDAKLTVAGDVHSKEVRVTVNAGSDFVFLDSYNLRPLSEVEKFIKDNKHLPDIAPAKEMETNGVELGEMDMKLLQKIEELTLYLIELKKEVDELRGENKTLKEKMSKGEEK